MGGLFEFVKQAGGAAWLEGKNERHLGLDAARSEIVRRDTWTVTITSVDPGYVTCSGAVSATIEKFTANYFHGLAARVTTAPAT